ncbi:MAG: R3H domain-containing nucleic acid-binding protein [Candidatus Peribacteraceae bacterium]|jgi:spoIIIJ-associated protein
MDASMIKDTLGSLLKLLPFTFTDVQVLEEKDGVTRVELVSTEASRIIGWHGETLNAIQHLAKSIIRAKENMERSPFIVVDIDGYRKSQEEKVCKIAEQKADFVRRTGNRIALAPMSPYFRRIVHLYVANSPQLQDLTTESVGEGEYRQIVMKLKEEKGSEELSPVMAEDTGLENLDI